MLVGDRPRGDRLVICQTVLEPVYDSRRRAEALVLGVQRDYAVYNVVRISI